jgi:hypothetical protein
MDWGTLQFQLPSFQAKEYTASMQSTGKSLVHQFMEIQPSLLSKH